MGKFIVDTNAVYRTRGGVRRTNTNYRTRVEKPLHLSGDRPYIIWTPPYYGQASGGIRALHILANEIIRYGGRAYIGLMYGFNPRSPAPFNCANPYGLKYYKDGLTKCEIDEAIHVYPDCMDNHSSEARKGVPKAKYWCYWLLNKAMFEIPKGVPVWAWDPATIGKYPRLNVNVIDETIFFPKKRPGKGVVYYEGKGTIDRKIIKPDWKEITLTWPACRGELATLLRESDYLVSFDPYSSLAFESTLCGTPVVGLFSKVQRPGGYNEWTWDELKNGLVGMRGIVPSFKDLDKARIEVETAWSHHLHLVELTKNDVPDFIKLSQELFK